MAYTTATLRSLDDLVGALNNEIKWQEYFQTTAYFGKQKKSPTDNSRFTRYGTDSDTIKGFIELANILLLAEPVPFFVSDISNIDYRGRAFPPNHPKLVASYSLWVPPVQTAKQEGDGLYSCGGGEGNTHEEVMRSVRAHAGADIVGFYGDLSPEGWEERVPFFINKEWYNERQRKARDYILKVVVPQMPVVLAPSNSISVNLPLFMSNAKLNN